MVAHRLWLPVQTSILCVICAFGPPHARGRIVANVGPSRATSHLPTPGARTLHDNPAHTLHLQNSSWSQIRVEVRTGPYTTCDSLGSLGVQVLQQGQEWQVEFDDSVICWRRDQTPGDAASKWAAWHQVKLADGEVRVMAL